MAQHPAHDLATALAVGSSVTLLSPPGGSVTVGYGAGAANIVRGPARDTDELVANQLINVLPTGGPPPMPFMGAATNENLYAARVQVVVRSKAEQYESGEALARAVRAKLHLVVISGYVSVMAQESEPNYLGVDDRGLHRFSVNFMMTYKA